MGASLCDESIELLSVVVKSGGGPLLLGLLYRPPGSDTSVTQLESALQQLHLDQHPRVGDFNVDLLKTDSSSRELEAYSGHM